MFVTIKINPVTHLMNFFSSSVLHLICTKTVKKCTITKSEVFYGHLSAVYVPAVMYQHLLSVYGSISSHCCSVVTISLTAELLKTSRARGWCVIVQLHCPLFAGTHCDIWSTTQQVSELAMYEEFLLTLPNDMHVRWLCLPSLPPIFLPRLFVGWRKSARWCGKLDH